MRPVSLKSAPATFGLIVACAIGFVVAWLTTGTATPWLAFQAPDGKPWGAITFPFIGDGNGGRVLFFLLMLVWMFWIGSTTESELGRNRFLAYFFGLTLASSLGLLLGSLALGTGAFLVGPYLPVAAMTVGWGLRHRSQSIMLYGILPLSGVLMAILTVVLVLFSYGTGSPLMGVFALLPLGLAALFTTGKIPGLEYARAVAPHKPSKAQLEKEKEYFDEVKRREKEREERERLRKLLGE